MKFKPPDIPQDRKDLELLSKEALEELAQATATPHRKTDRRGRTAQRTM